MTSQEQQQLFKKLPRRLQTVVKNHMVSKFGYNSLQNTSKLPISYIFNHLLTTVSIERYVPASWSEKKQ